MMIYKRFALILPVFLFFTVLVKGDAAPEPGFKRAKIDLVLETAEDLSDYRFFLDFYGDLREVEVKSKDRTVIESMGGGARYASGTLLAIPKKNLKDLDEAPSSEQLENLSKSLKDKKIEGVTEIARHSFSRDIPKGDAAPEVLYTLKKEEGVLKATRTSNEKPKTGPAQLVPMSSSAGLTVGGIFLTLAVLVFG